MAQGDASDRRQATQHEVGLRYRLGNPEIGGRDFTRRTPAGKVRYVEYDRPTQPQLELRTRLIARGLILGRLVSDSRDGKQLFQIPRSSRPISYETNVPGDGEFTYADSQLFYDAGKLLGSLAMLSDDAVVTGDIGKTIALVEFTRPNEPSLYLAPGIERVTELHPNNDLVGYYQERFHEVFGERFAEMEFQVAAGFDDAHSGDL